MRDIINRNDKGQLHGYQEWYLNGKLCYKGFWYNDIPVDYEEFYWVNHNLKTKTFYI